MFTYKKPFRLSTKGSTRATAYSFANKSIVHDGKLHVVWLDAVAQVCGRTCNLTTGEWSETHYLFTGCDNHTNPALALDGQGYLHLAYGPHGYWGGWNNGCFKGTVSAEPGIINRWEGDFNFGYLATYASLLTMPNGCNAIVYRGGDTPAALMFQHQSPLGGWNPAQALLHQKIAPQYTNYGGILACAADGTLYAGCHFYNLGKGDPSSAEANQEIAQSHGAAVIKSTDSGATWTDLSGTPLQTPALYSENIAIPPLHSYVYIKGLAVDSKGNLWALTLKPAIDDKRILLSRWDKTTGWVTADLQSVLPADRIAVDATMTIDTRDRIHLALCAVLSNISNNSGWGDPTSEIFHLVTDGSVAGSSCRHISTTGGDFANWIPSISLNAPFQPVVAPTILYTHGPSGSGCAPATETEVWCVQMSES